VARVRRLTEMGVLKERPQWLEWAERVPPMENTNLNLQVRTIRNPYPQMIEFLLKKYPDLRFQDCYVDGNDWSVGNDAYRDDHPVMQFVARQLDFMNQGFSKKKAFRMTEELFRERREYLEREQKVMMAMALDSGIAPMFTTGSAYLQTEAEKAEEAHLRQILKELRLAKKEKAGKKMTEAQARSEERKAHKKSEKDRQELVGTWDVLGEAWDEEEPSAEMTFEALQEVSPIGTDIPDMAIEDEAPPLHIDTAADGAPEEGAIRAAKETLKETASVSRTSDVEQTRGVVQPRRPAPDFSPDSQKPEDDIMLTSRRASRPSGSTKTAKDVGAMLSGEGVLGEDSM